MSVPKTKLAAILLGVYVALCVGALTWPGFAWIQERAPMIVLGIPFALFWSILWILLTFAMLCLFHVLRGEESTP